MSFLAKNIINNYSPTRISFWSYFFNDTRLCFTQYHTCLNTPVKIQSKFVKQNKLIKRNSSVLQIFKTTYMYRLFDSSKHWIGSLRFLIPFYGLKGKRLGFYWYKSLDELKIQDYFTIFEMQDTFSSRFKIIELHVWMLLYHLPRTNKYYKYMRLGVIEAMWEDSERRANMLADYNVNYKKNFRTLNNKFKLSLLLYDIGFSKNDVALSSAVWYNFFSKNNVDPILLECLVSYIRCQMHHLNKLNLDVLSSVENKTGIWIPVKSHVEGLLNSF